MMTKTLILFLIMAMTAFGAQAQESNDSQFKGSIKIEVDGLSCPFCAYGLEKNLKKVKGVGNIKIDVDNAFVLIDILDGKSIGEKLLRKSITDAGFTPRDISSRPE